MRLNFSARTAAFLAASLFVTSAVTGQHWQGSWGASPHLATSPEDGRPAVEHEGRTLRQTVRISAGGDRLRIRLSNELSPTPQKVGEVTIALVGSNGKLRPETIRKVTFSGAGDTLIDAGAPLISDPVTLKVGDRATLAVSIYLPDGVQRPTVHSSAYATGWSAVGSHASAPDLPEATSFTERVLISGVDIEAPKPRPVIVTLGDSITDGTRTTIDANRRWPDLLADRLVASRKPVPAVVNAGIGGNRLLELSRSPSALARFDRDVLAVPGVSHLIILIGVNDIGNASPTDLPVKVSQMIGGYRQLIDRAHAKGIRVYLGTIVPFKGAKYWSEDKEAVRKQVNEWIRGQTLADGMIDFDRAMRSETDLDRMRAEYDVGDALHPNDAGMMALSNAVSLGQLLP